MVFELATIGVPERLTDPTWKMRIRGRNHDALFRFLDPDDPAERMFPLGLVLLVTNRMEHLVSV
jgi:hypothetical protein